MSDWHRVSRLLDELLDLPSEERVPAARRRCEGEPGVLEEVLRLLRADEGKGFLDDALDASPLFDGDRPPQLSAGSQLGRFQIVEHLGSGGMGAVYRAIDPRLERHVAVKIFHVEMHADRFEREAKLLAALNHPNISTIYEFGSDEDTQPFIVMEYVTGRSLDALFIAGEDIVDPIVALRRVASAIEAAHARGIVHRDIKPGNIMIGPKNSVKVLDFGLAVQVGTGSTEAVGTPGYMSPEQARGEAVGERSDVFSFGCVAFELLSGTRAFGGTADERMQRNLDGTVDWTQLDTSDAVVELLKACFSPSPTDRPSARDVRRQLDAIAQRPSVPSPASPIVRPATTFLGRHQALDDLGSALVSNRLVTLAGPGGGGKTRLSLEYGAREESRYPDGVYLVRLAPVADPELVAEHVGSVLEVAGGGHDLVESISEAIGDRRLLLILDNCEHVVEASAAIARRIVECCPNATVLATSREPLGVSGEQVLRLPPLDASAARALFADRAAGVDSSFDFAPHEAAIGNICERLDHLPLAIELAAARADVLTVGEIEARLGRRFELLTSRHESSESHHGTLRQLIDWSFDLLSPEAQTLLVRLSIFPGTWSADAAETVCTGSPVEPWTVLDLIGDLQAKSLIERDVEESKRCSQARFRCLESIRAFCSDLLDERGERDVIETKLVEYVCALSEDVDKAFEGDDQVTYTERFAADRASFIAVAESGRISPGDRLLAMGRIGRLWSAGGEWTLGRRILRDALDKAQHLPPSEATISARTGLAVIKSMQTGYDDAALIEESLRDAQAIGADHLIVRLTINLAIIAKNLGDVPRAESYIEESLRVNEEVGSPVLRAHALGIRSALATRRGKWKSAKSDGLEGLKIMESLSDDRGRLTILDRLAANCAESGEWEDVIRYATEGLDLAEPLGAASFEARLLPCLGAAYLAVGRPREARRLASKTIERGKQHNSATTCFRGHLLLGNILVTDDDFEAGEREYEAAATFAAIPLDHLLINNCLALTARRRGELTKAARILQPVLASIAELEGWGGLDYLLESAAQLSAAGMHERAVRCWIFAEKLAREYPASRSSRHSDPEGERVSRQKVGDGAVAALADELVHVEEDNMLKLAADWIDELASRSDVD